MSYYCGLLYCIDKIFRRIQGDCFKQSYTLLEYLCGIVHFLLNTFIIVTSFVWGQHRVFMTAIFTGEWDILILQKIRLLGLCEIVHFLLNTVIIMNYFVQIPHCVFVIAIVTGECAVLILQHYGLVYVITTIVYWSTMIMLFYHVLF